MTYEWSTKFAEQSRKVAKRYYFEHPNLRHRPYFLNFQHNVADSHFLAMNTKMFYGCELCGFKNDEAKLGYYHNDDDQKSKWVSRLYTSPTETMGKEIKKCRVLCRRCHKKLHVNQLNF